MKLFRWFRERPESANARILYACAVAQARLPAFYLAGEVPDTIDGRFDLTSLHVALILRRLRAADAPARRLSQALFDVMFDNLDSALREMGVGDMSVGKKMRGMASAFYGRLNAYTEALDAQDTSALRAALRRNLYRGQTEVSSGVLAAMAAYVTAQAQAIETQPVSRLYLGIIDFLPPDMLEGRATEEAAEAEIAGDAA